MEITTPESVGNISGEMDKASDTSNTRQAFSSLQGSPAETEGIEWQLLMGGNYGDSLNDIQLTNDGGYIAAGAIASTNGEVPLPSLGSSDAWVVKINSTGSIEWQKRYGGSNYDQAMSIRRTLDGGYVFAGRSASAGTHGSDDVWVVKLDSNGNQQWQSFMGGSYSDYGHSIRQTADGGYIVAGNTFSKDIETAGNDIGGIYAARLDSSGTVLWQRAIGGSGNDFGSSIIPSDGGYILAGYSDSTDFGADQRKGAEDIVVIRLDESGDQDWLKVIGGIGYDRTGYDNVISPAPGGGYILTAQSTSGDIADIHGSFDALVVKLNPDGTIYEEGQKKWLKMYGGSCCEVTGSITPLSDGGYMLTSQAASSQSGDIPEKNFGEHDIWVVRLDSEGTIVWQKLMGGNRWDQTTSIRETTDGGYIFAGFTQSSDSGYIGTNHGYEDAWIVKLNPRLTVDVMDADDRNMSVLNATVFLYDVNTSEEQNITAAKGHAVFADSGELNRSRLVKGGKYSVRAVADNYRESPVVNITYSGDGQRVKIYLNAYNRPIEKTFSITNTLYENKSPSYNSINTVAAVEGRLTGAQWVKVFSVQGPDVTAGYFGGDSSIPSKSLNDATLHYHVGHGSLVDNKTGNSSLILLKTTETNGNYDTIWFNATDVKNKWGGKNKWVVLQTCNNLRDKKWGSVLGTTHGIFGFANVSDNRAAVPNDFFVNALLGETLYDSWRSATVNNLGGVKVASGIDENGNLTGRVNITAVAYFKTNTQMMKDHLPDGEIAPDGDPNKPGFVYDAWDCGSNNRVIL